MKAEEVQQKGVEDGQFRTVCGGLYFVAETRDEKIRNYQPAFNQFLTQRKVSDSWRSFDFRVTQL